MIGHGGTAQPIAAVVLMSTNVAPWLNVKFYGRSPETGMLDELADIDPLSGGGVQILVFSPDGGHLYALDYYNGARSWCTHAMRRRDSSRASNWPNRGPLESTSSGKR